MRNIRIPGGPKISYLTGVIAHELPRVSSLGTTTPEAGNPQQFDVYWNVPTFVCHKYGVKFEDLKNFGINQNANDTFRGEKIAILYDPGMFPALLSDKNGKPKVLVLLSNKILLKQIYKRLNIFQTCFKCFNF